MSYFNNTPVIFAPGDPLKADYRKDLFVESEERIQRFIRHLEPALHARSPRDLLVAGESGSGKTWTVRFVLDLLEQEMEQVKRALTKVHVTASQDSTSYQVLIKILNTLRKSRGEDPLTNTGHAYDHLQDELANELNRLTGVVFIVVDEADDISDPEKLFNGLSRIRERYDVEGLKLGLIGIANDASWIEELGSATRSTFRPIQVEVPGYTVDDLRKILRRRGEEGFKEDVLTERVVRLCAARCAQSGGDARRGLEMLAQAGEVARLRIDQSDNPESEPRQITEQDLKQAEEELAPAWVEKTVTGLSDTGQRVLYCVARRQITTGDPVRTSEVHKVYTGQFSDYDKSERSVREYLRTLSDRGLLLRDTSNNGLEAENPGRFHVYQLEPEMTPVIEALGNGGWVDAELLTNLCDDTEQNGWLLPSENDRLTTTLNAD